MTARGPLAQSLVLTVKTTPSQQALKKNWALTKGTNQWVYPTSIFITITLVKVRLFCWWCHVCCTVLLTLCIIILRARHDQNKIAPCGMIKVF